MADRPIPFSASMVRALLAGTKSQTRRVLKPQPELYAEGLWHVFGTGGGVAGVHTDDVPEAALAFLRYAIGDRLWVREAWRTLHKFDCLAPRNLADDPSKITYEADPERRNPLWAFGRLRAGMHMPRWASRLTLTVTDVRVERLQDISEADAIAEGLEETITFGHSTWGIKGLLTGQTPVRAYSVLWDIINGDGAWAANPFVVATTFETHFCNIDGMASTSHGTAA